MKLGIILDGFWSSDNLGYYLIIYDQIENKLVRYFDKTTLPTLKFTGIITDEELSYTNISKMDDYLHENVVKTTEIPLNDFNKLNKVKLKTHPRVNKKEIIQMQYFYKRQLIPGNWIKIKNNNLVEINVDQKFKEIETRNIFDEIISKQFIGESYELLDMAKNNMPKFNQPIAKLKRAAFDIEVKVPRGYFPVPEKAEYDVHMVGIYDSDDNAFLYLLGFSPSEDEINLLDKELGYNLKVYSFMSKKQFLNALFSKLKEYPILISFNGDNFDLPYLYYYSKNNGVLPPIHLGHLRKNKKSYHVDGTIHIDLYRFFSNISIKNYAFKAKYELNSLDSIAEALLGKKKISHDLWFDEMSTRELLKYTITDVELTYKLTSFSNSLVIHLMLILMRISKITLTMVNRQSISQWIFNWITYEHYRFKAIIPNKSEIRELKGEFRSQADIKGKQYKGAIVLEPKPGVWWNVIVVDFNSLYPSIIKNYNLSYETIHCSHVECKFNTVPELDHWVCNQKQGIMSLMVGFVRDARLRWYKPKSKQLIGPEKELYKSIEAALKVLINASYGVFGSENFELFCPPLAESVTAYARNAILQAKKIAEDQGALVLYGDTDSTFLYGLSEEALRKIKIWSIVELGIELGVDYEFRFLVLSNRKKNYFGITKNGDLILKGLQVKKKNTPQIIRSTFSNIIDKLKQVQTPDELENSKNEMIEILKDTISRLKNLEIPFENLTQNVTLNKKFEEYQAKTDAVQIALQKINPNNIGEVKQGSQFTIVKVKPFKIFSQTDIFPNFLTGSEIECRVKELNNIQNSREIDIDKYLELLKKAFYPIFDAFDLDLDSVLEGETSLDKYL